MPPPTGVIEVWIWGKRAGAVAADPNLGCYVFEYDRKWLQSGVELAPIMMRTDRPRVFAFPQLGESFRGLPGLLADALPDDFGNALVDAWMAERGITKSEITSLQRLAYMGKRGMGALEFKPSQGARTESAQPLAMKELVEAARQAVHGNFEDDAHARAALANIIRVGTSAGGARAKAVIAWHPTSHEIRSGQFNVADGFEHWLLKFDGIGADRELGTSADYGRIEYAYHLMALRAGIRMAPCRLLEENGRAHFMTKRFDRDGNTKHHLQSLCALQHLDYKQRASHSYEQLFLTISTLQIGPQAMEEAFRRMAFNVMARNCDDHAKNFSFRLKEGGHWEISPAYDVTHAHNPKGEWTAQHLMSVNGRFDEIRRADLLAVADRFVVSDPKGALGSVAAAIRAWPEFAAAAGVPSATKDRVQNDFRIV
jgi:serine/threonine-protein kinase HipA